MSGMNLAQRFEQAMAVRTRATPESIAPTDRVLNARCVVGVGEAMFLLEFECGRLAACRRHAGLLVTYDFAVLGSEAAWNSLWSDPPPPGRQDLFGLYKTGEIRLEGRLEPFMAHLQYLKDLLASPRKEGR